MKYKTRITEEENKYIGYAILNEQVVYTTNALPDPVMVARELSSYIASAPSSNKSASFSPTIKGYTQPSLPVKSIQVKRNVLNNTPSSPVGMQNNIPSTSSIAPDTIVPRKCCGRG